MKIATVNTLHVARREPQWQAAESQFTQGDVERVEVPVATTDELPVLQALMRATSAPAATALPDIGSGGVTLSVRFADQADMARALGLLQPNVSRAAAGHPGLSIAQGAAGGAVIGAVGGAGVMALINALKSTTDSVGDPVLATLGAVLAGIAGGAVLGGSGAAVIGHGPKRLSVDVNGKFVGFSGGVKLGADF